MKATTNAQTTTWKRGEILTTMQARREGTCRLCGQAIQIGEEIALLKAIGLHKVWVHVECARGPLYTLRAWIRAHVEAIRRGEEEIGTHFTGRETIVSLRTTIPVQDYFRPDGAIRPEDLVYHMDKKRRGEDAELEFLPTLYTFIVRETKKLLKQGA